MLLRILILSNLVLLPLAGCVGVPGPTAAADPARRTVRLPTALASGNGQASTLILGVQ